MGIFSLPFCDWCLLWVYSLPFCDWCPLRTHLRLGNGRRRLRLHERRRRPLGGKELPRLHLLRQISDPTLPLADRAPRRGRVLCLRPRGPRRPPRPAAGTGRGGRGALAGRGQGQPRLEEGHLRLRRLELLAQAAVRLRALRV
eukprot:9490135-Pyramimonas_sp.AAC.1